MGRSDWGFGDLFKGHGFGRAVPPAFPPTTGSGAI
jgi:hypothetical protein